MSGYRLGDGGGLSKATLRFSSAWLLPRRQDGSRAGDQGSGIKRHRNRPDIMELRNWGRAGPGATTNE